MVQRRNVQTEVTEGLMRLEYTPERRELQVFDESSGELVYTFTGVQEDAGEAGFRSDQEDDREPEPEPEQEDHTDPEDHPEATGGGEREPRRRAATPPPVRRRGAPRGG